MAVAVSTGGRIPAVSVTDPFERLFAAEYGKVVAIAYRVLADAYEAEDVAQDVFVAFHGRHDPTAPYAPAWLYAAAAHTALNVIRGKKRRAQREEREAGEHARLRMAAETGLDPQQAALDAEQRREVRDALTRIPARSATLLALRYSGLSYAEVARALDLKPSHVGTMLARAEAALRKEMTRATHR